MHTYTYAYIYKCIHIQMHTFTYVYIYIHIHVPTYIYIYIYFYLYILHKYINRKKTRHILIYDSHRCSDNNVDLGDLRWTHGPTWKPGRCRWVPFQRLGVTQLVAGHLAWRVPGLVNIQKAIENGDL